jgi:hypothetical protein
MNDIELKEEQPESVTILIDQPAPIDPHEKAREEAFDATYDWKGQPLATKIVWLCLTPTDELIAKRRNPEAMSAEIWKWADANVGGDENEAILDLADKVLTASQSTRAVPIPSNGVDSGN